MCAEKPLKKEKCVEMPVSRPGMVVINGQPGGGKSHLIRTIVYMFRKEIMHAICFSKSAFREEVNLEYIPHFTGTDEEKEEYLNFKWVRYNEGALRKFLDFQESFKEGKRPLGCIIIDDEISEPAMYTSEALIDAVTIYRHFNVLVILATQYINKFPPVIRECASQVAIFSLDAKRSIQACYESYGQDFDNYNQFNRWLESVTQPVSLHNFAYKDKKQLNGKKWYVLRAPKKIPKFRIDFGLRKYPINKRLWGREKEIFKPENMPGKNPYLSKGERGRKRKREGKADPGSSKRAKGVLGKSMEMGLAEIRGRSNDPHLKRNPYEDSVFRTVIGTDYTPDE